MTDDDLVRVTVYCKSVKISPLMDAIEEEREVFVRKPKAKAFCEGCDAETSVKLAGGKTYRNGAKYIGIMIDKPVDGWLCSYCNHAITWYSIFEENK